MITHMILVPLSQETVALALKNRSTQNESLDDVIARTLSCEGTELPTNAKAANLDSARSGIGIKGSGFWFEWFGERREARNRTELFVSVLVLIGSRDESLFERLSKHGKQRKRRMIAKNREDLYPQDAKPSVKREARRLPGDWWVGTNYATKDKTQFLVKASAEAGVTFGKDLIIDPRLLDGVIVPLSDDDL